MNTSLLHHLWSLIKPRVVTLLCVAGLFSLLAAGGSSVTLVAGFLVAGGCIAASGAAFNCWYDRHLDRYMERTASRPLPSGRLDHRIAAAFALSLLILGTTIGVVVLPIDSVVYMLLGFTATLASTRCSSNDGTGSASSSGGRPGRSPSLPAGRLSDRSRQAHS